MKTSQFQTMGVAILCFALFMQRLERHFMRKSLLINDFNLSQMILELTFQYSIFLYEKVIETVTEHENGCSNVLF